MHYHAIIHREGTQYGVTFPDFEGCVTVGETREIAFENAVEALNLHIEGMRQDGLELPVKTPFKDIFISSYEYVVCVPVEETHHAASNIIISPS